MRLWRRCFVFLPNLDRLVTLGRDHAQARLVKQDVKDGRLARQRAWLQGRLELLEVVARLPVEEVQRAVVRAADEHVVTIDS